jgi:hypothetical protein
VPTKLASCALTWKAAIESSNAIMQQPADPNRSLIPQSPLRPLVSNDAASYSQTSPQYIDRR